MSDPLARPPTVPATSSARARAARSPSGTCASSTTAVTRRCRSEPSTYTAARRAVDTGLPIAGPLYLRWPRQEAAYEHPTQFTSGRDLVVAPVTEPSTSPGESVDVELWVPPGQWVERTTGERLRGPRLATVTAALDHVPVLVRAGSVLPGHLPGQRAGVDPSAILVLDAFPGARGRGEVYDDAGSGYGYERGQHTRTSFTQRRSGDTVVVTVGRARGDFRGALRSRTWDLRLHDVDRPRRVSVDGRRTNRWEWDAGTRVLRVVLDRIPSRDGATVRVR